MCRSIKPLYNFEPPATEEEIRSAALQFVRKVSGFHEPSKVNQTAFERGVDEVAEATQRLFEALSTPAKPHDREVEAAKARKRASQRFNL